ncbi:MAG: hypothetical protein PVJ68_05225 [Candidatus Thiodiazotropha sp.]|jgi:hypothetical protein
MKIAYNLILIMFLLPLLVGCPKEYQEVTVVMPKDLTNDLETVANAKVFFGHQSVGNNIIDGLQSISDNIKSVDLRVSDYESYQPDDKGCLLHTRVGKNREPESKCIDFGRIIDEELSDKIDYALLKFCYVDIDRDSNVSKVFNDYKQTIDGLMSRHPEITFVHTTVPLKLVRSGWKLWIKELLGKENLSKLDNIKRNEFNELLKATYGVERLIDIAKSESTYPDGKREAFEMDGKTYYSLIWGYTNDGGHLNDNGKIQVASTFVQELAQIIRDSSSVAE